MRNDIVIDINDGGFSVIDTEISDIIKVCTVKDNFTGTLLDKYVYLECIVDDDDINIFDNCTITVHIPYIPIEKNVMIRFGVHENNQIKYFVNGVNNSYYTQIKASSNSDIPVSMLRIINRDGNFVLKYNSHFDFIEIYDAQEYDFQIQKSLYQDAQVIIKNYITSNSKHPLSGVGIQEYLNSPSADKRLNQRVLSELNSDGIVPKSVILNGGLITLDLDENNNSLGYEEIQQVR